MPKKKVLNAKLFLNLKTKQNDEENIFVISGNPVCS